MDITTWERRRTEDGHIQIRSRDGLSITIRERVRPTAPLRVFAGTTPPTALRTLEGEDGYLVRIDREGTACALAIVEGDDFQLLIEGEATANRFAALSVAVENLARTYPLGLGTGRVRRIRHDGPANWREERDGMASTWTAPTGDAVIKVLPARPLAEAKDAFELAIQLHDDRFEHLTLERELERGPIVIGSLRGSLGRAIGRYGDGPMRVIMTAGLSDLTHRYTVRLDRDASSDHDGAFFDLLKSIVPITPAARVTALNALGHWAD